MKRIVCLNPAVSTTNMGDHIIAECAKEQLQCVLRDSFTVDISTHLPISDFYADYLANADLRFVLGTNLLRNTMTRKFRQWDIDARSAKKLSPSVLMGVGWHNDGEACPRRVENLYRTILAASPYTHSVRDSYTLKRLSELGITNVLNTGCPSMWKLTSEHCRTIPEGKAENVVFTVTDYHPNVEDDVRVLRLLKARYKTVYIWLQGYYDADYLRENALCDGVTVLPPALAGYDALLSRDDVEYVGTRLHGGIRALQHGRRTMILAVDERAVEKQKDFNLPVVRRTECDRLEALIEASRPTEIHIAEREIAQWKAQFAPFADRREDGVE